MLPPKKTMKRYNVPGTARFITFSCYRRLRLFDNDLIKDHFVSRLVDLMTIQPIDNQRVDVLAWVVMPEHVHMVLLPEPAEALSPFLASLKRSFSTQVLRRWRDLDAGILPRLRDRQGDHHFWQLGGGYDRNVVGHELLEKVRYCHSNPVSRGLVEQAVDWKWSSARAYKAADRGAQETVGEVIGPTIAFDLLPSVDRPLT